MDAPLNLVSKGSLIYAALTAVFVISGYSLVFAEFHRIQVKGEANASEKDMNYRDRLTATRGLILDREGRRFAVSYLSWVLSINPAKIPEKKRAKIWCELMEFDVFDGELVRNVLSKTNNHYYAIGYTKNDDLVAAIRTNAVLKNIVSRDKSDSREYPMQRQASHIIGAVNSSGVGLDGAEKTFDKWLVGTNGIEKGRKNEGGKLIPYMQYETVEAVDGASVYLTIDRNVQDIVETALDEWMEKTRAELSWVVVQNPKTGEILAMASRPDYDPADYNSSPQEHHRNRAVFENHEPGSILKPLTFAAALEEKLVRPDTVIDVPDIPYGGGRIGESHTIPGNKLTLTEAMKISSNRAAARCASWLGRDRFEAYMRDFGMSEHPGSGLLGESRGRIAYGNIWSEMDLTRRGFGQGLDVTALQMSMAYSALANGGAMMWPAILSRIEKANGEIVYEHVPTVKHRPVSEKTARETVAMMCTVTGPEGTAPRARIPGYSVAGKTGTAQIAEESGGYNDRDYTASFAGFFPASDPQIVIVIGLYKARDKTDGDRQIQYHYGGLSAAPFFAQIGEKIARQLRIIPDLPHEL